MALLVQNDWKRQNKKWLFAGLMVLAIGLAMTFTVTPRYLRQKRLQSEIPKYLQALRAQRESLQAAIESYHRAFGFYPPNRGTNAPARAVTNPLYYELVGTRWNTNYQSYCLPTTKATIKREEIERYFGMSSFSNSLTYPASPTNFLAGLRFSGREENGVILAGAWAPDDLPDELTDEFQVTSWRYVSDPATPSASQFDLWIELTVRDSKFVIGNWEGTN